MKFLIILFYFFLQPIVIISDVRSLTGNIPFDSNGDTYSEMSLTTAGLGIGVTPASNLHVQGNAIITGKLDVGGQGGSSNLNIFGSMGMSISTISSNATLGDTTNIFVNTASNNIFLSLPAANLVSGRIYKIKKTSLLNQLWITAGENIEGFCSRIEAPAVTPSDELPYLELISNGSSWYLLNISSSIKNVIGGDNLVARWLLDETSGLRAADSSSHNHHCTLKGGTFSFSANTTSGKIGRALNLNGSTDYIELPYSSDLNTSKFTCSLWVRVTGGANYRSPLTSRGTTINGYVFYATDANKWEFWTYDGSVFSVSIGSSVSIGVWTFLVGVYDGTNRIFYINGQQVASNIVSFNPNTSSPLRIGAGATEGTPLFFFNGDIDDVRIYNRALSSAEIQEIYRQNN